jgi:hypothetical protein
VRIGVRFAVDMFLPFIPRTPDRRITPPFGSATFGSWPARALTIFVPWSVHESDASFLVRGGQRAGARASIWGRAPAPVSSSAPCGAREMGREWMSEGQRAALQDEAERWQNSEGDLAVRIAARRLG